MAATNQTADYSQIILPPDLDWYEELGGQRTGWVCDVDGPGWWHVEELDLRQMPKEPAHA